MAILSKRIMSEVSRSYFRRFRVRPGFVDLSGRFLGGADALSVLAGLRRKRSYGLQESINHGAPYLLRPAPSVVESIAGLEDRRMIHGGITGGAVLVCDAGEDPLRSGSPLRERAHAHLTAHGADGGAALAIVRALPVWPESQAREACDALYETFYQVSGWSPDLMRENRLKCQQQAQINEAIDDRRKKGKEALYAFEKERALLAYIRAGDRSGARSILNDMLAVIYLSSPQLVVLRARAIELMTCLTRAAIEDNPLMEPLIERNHAWTERLVSAGSFERLSEVLMEALDDFIEGIYLHGVNRSNPRVHQALDFMSRNFMKRMSLAAVAREVGLSPCRLCHLVKEFTGRTVVQILQQLRIDHAQHLLTRTSKSCADIAYEVGFSDQSHFIRHFRRLTGTTPARYRRQGGAG